MALTGSGLGRKVTLEDRLIARMLAPWLDRELAAGWAKTSSAAHAAGADQLAGARARRAVARSLDRLVDRAEKPRRRFVNVLIPPCREQVREAMPLILSIQSRLRSTEALDALVIARLKTLLSDRSGPCYVRSAPDALAVALSEIAESLSKR